MGVFVISTLRVIALVLLGCRGAQEPMAEQLILERWIDGRSIRKYSRRKRLSRLCCLCCIRKGSWILWNNHRRMRQLQWVLQDLGINYYFFLFGMFAIEAIAV